VTPTQGVALSHISAHVVCSDGYTVKGEVRGLGESVGRFDPLVLTLADLTLVSEGLLSEAAPEVAIISSGPFGFSNIFPVGFRYEITLKRVPSNHACALVDGSGQGQLPIPGSGHASSIVVLCHPTLVSLKLTAAGLEDGQLAVRAVALPRPDGVPEATPGAEDQAVTLSAGDSDGNGGGGGGGGRGGEVSMMFPWQLYCGSRVNFTITQQPVRQVCHFVDMEDIRLSALGSTAWLTDGLTADMQ